MTFYSLFLLIVVFNMFPEFLEKNKDIMNLIRDILGMKQNDLIFYIREHS